MVQRDTDTQEIRTVSLKHFYTCCPTACAHNLKCVDVSKVWFWLFYQEWPWRHSQLKIFLGVSHVFYLVNWTTTTADWDWRFNQEVSMFQLKTLVNMCSPRHLHACAEGCHSPFAKYRPLLPCNAHTPALLLPFQPRFLFCDKGPLHRHRVSPEFD